MMILSPTCHNPPWCLGGRRGRCQQAAQLYPYQALQTHRVNRKIQFSSKRSMFIEHVLEFFFLNIFWFLGYVWVGFTSFSLHHED